MATPLDDGEPVFILRGNDAIAEVAVDAWIRQAIQMGVSAEVIEAATAVLAAMEAWPHKKLPD